MTYPNVRILHFGRDDNALYTAIGRVDYLADDNGSGGIGSHLVDYLYMGTGTMVQQADANGVEAHLPPTVRRLQRHHQRPPVRRRRVTGLDCFDQADRPELGEHDDAHARAE